MAAPKTFEVTGGQQVAVPEDVAPLFTPFKVGRFQLSNRVVMPPLTRSRALGTIPQPSAAQYYCQRAVKGGLIIAEGTVIAPEGHGYPNTPGLFLPEQVEAWKPIVKAVKGKGAVFFNQIWHCGRASHPEYQPGGGLPLGPSAIGVTSPEFKVYTSKGEEDYVVPREMTKDDIKQAVQYFRQGARNAIEAGFDGVEIHGGNGYLIDNFIKDSCNQRTDEYGGTIENRCRLPLEIVQAVVDEVGADRVGLRLTPFTQFLDAVDSTPYATHMYLVEQINKLKLAYLHMVEPRVIGNTDMTETPADTLEPFRKVCRTVFIAAGGYTRKLAVDAINTGHADLVAFGRSYLANPDLHKRLLLNAPLNRYDRNTFYTSGMEGYLDYPLLEDVKK